MKAGSSFVLFFSGWHSSLIMIAENKMISSVSLRYLFCYVENILIYNFVCLYERKWNSSGRREITVKLLLGSLKRISCNFLYCLLIRLTFSDKWRSSNNNSNNNNKKTHRENIFVFHFFFFQAFASRWKYEMRQVKLDRRWRNVASRSCEEDER